MTGGTDFSSGQGTLQHSFTLSGLQSGQTYTLFYKAKDTSGNIDAQSTIHTFMVNNSVPFKLTVVSSHGSPVPGVGDSLFANGQLVNCSVSTPVVESGVVYACTGWTGTGSVPSSGSSASVSFNIVQNSNITWNWVVSQFDFNVTVSPSALAINAGSNATLGVTATLTSGVSQSVAWSCTGLPAGTSTSFSPASGMPPFNSTLTLITSASTPVGSYTLYVNGTGPTGSHVSTVQLRILANTADTTPPAFGSIGANTTIAGGPVRLSCLVSDDVAVSSYLYSWNNTGSWVNQTVVAVSGSPIATGFVGTWSSVAGAVVSVRVYANDSSNNWAVSDQYTFTLAPNIVSISIVNPQNITYSSTSIPVSLTFSGGYFQAAWFNVRNGSSWVYGVNQTYAAGTNITGYVDGTYVFYAYANSTAGTVSSASVAFSVSVPPVTIAITNPQNLTYTTSTVPVALSFSGGSLLQAWYNVRNGSSWVYASNGRTRVRLTFWLR